LIDPIPVKRIFAAKIPRSPELNQESLQSVASIAEFVTFQDRADVQAHWRVTGLSLPREDPTGPFLQDFIDALGSSVAILDENLTIRQVNRAWRQVAARTGASSGHYGVGGKYPEISGTSTASQKDLRSIIYGIRRIICGEENEFEMEYRCTAFTEPTWFRLHAAPCRVPGISIVSTILVTHENISAEKLQTAYLQNDREQRVRLLATTNIIPWEADAETRRFTYVGEQAAKMLGYSASSWLEPDFWISRLHPEDRDRVVAQNIKRSESGAPYQLSYRLVAKNGESVWINDVVSIEPQQGGSSMMRGFMIDITDGTRSEDALKLLSRRLITAQEEERKRIARDLHDDLNQRMALISIELEQIGQNLPDKTDGLAERVKSLQIKAQETSTELHRMSYSLHPSKLDHLGLVPALQSFCSEISESRRINVSFWHDDLPETIPPDITLCVFRIAQEALQNSAKHSGETQAHVELRIKDSVLELKVSDAGRGFDQSGDRTNMGLGFISMRERLRLVDGSITIKSKLSEGTQITVLVPLTSRGDATKDVNLNTP